MKVQIFSASLNPFGYYDYEAVSNMSFDEAVDFFDKDRVGACTCNLHEVDLTKPNEFSFYADGANEGKRCDTMFVWTKVTD